MTADDHKSSAELERELDHERHEIARKVDALQGKLSVGAMIDDALHGVRHGGGAFGSNLGRTISDNPVPVMLIGAGLAWLVASGGRHERHADYGRVHGAPDPLTPRGPIPAANPAPYAAQTYGRHEGGEGARHRLGEAASSASGAASHASHSASEGASRAAQASREGAYSAARGLGSAASIAGERARAGYASAGHGLASVGGYASSAASSAARRAGDLGHRAQSGFEDLLEEQPLAVGALAFAIGAAVGSLMPNTRYENELFGEQAERFRGEVYDAAREEAEKARRVAEAAYEAGAKEAQGAAREADERTPSATEAVKEGERRAGDAARRIGEAARAEADRQNLGDPATRPH